MILQVDIADFMPRGVGTGLGDLGDLGIAYRAVERVINLAFPQLVDMVEPDLLPVEKPNPRGRSRHYELYGCGLLGCVFPTSRPGVVFKITTDPSEIVYVEQVYTDRARFNHGPPEGVVKFLFYMPFPEGVTYRRHPVYALWREEVSNPGGLVTDDAWRQLPEATRMAVWRMADVKDAWTRVWGECVQTRDKIALWTSMQQNREAAAADVAEMFLDVPYSARSAMKGLHHQIADMPRGQRMAFLLEFGRRSIDIAITEPGLDLAKQALWYLAQRELYICDVHGGNLGQAERRGKLDWVISDVGQALDYLNPTYWVKPPPVK